MTSDSMELGGNIELSGFKDMDGATMIVLKKIVGTYAKKFSEMCKNFQKLAVISKAVHEREKSEKYEIHVRVIDNGTPYNANVTDFNLFFALDSGLKKVEHEIEHRVH